MASNRLRILCLATLAIAALSVGRSAHAQELDEESDPVLLKLHGKVMRFLDGIGGDEQPRAFDELLSGSQLLKQSEPFQALLKQSKEIEKKYGKYRESERIAARRVGKDLIFLRYLFKCENFPVIWYFAYYKDFSRTAGPSEDENWVIVAVRFDTQLELLDLYFTDREKSRFSQ